MNKRRLTDDQIIDFLKQAEAWEKTTVLCRHLGITKQTFY